MIGDVSIKAGEFQIQAGVRFEVCQTDNGVSLILRDERTNACYSVRINDCGRVVYAACKPIGGQERDDFVPVRPPQWEWQESHPPPKDINERFREASADPLKCFEAYARYKFTLRIDTTARGAKLAWPMAGYRAEQGTYILYRRPRQFRGECLLKLLDDHRVIRADEADSNRLPPEEWQRFLNISSRKRFTLNGIEWQKMTLSEIRTAVAGRVFECWLPDAGDAT